MNSIGYVQVVEMTDDEKIAMYMKSSKLELAKMLVEANKHLERIIEENNAKRYGYKQNHDYKVSVNSEFSSSTCVLGSDEFIEPSNCDHLCHDCSNGSFCWDSECNEKKES